jgi:hypothetical protein
LKRAQWKKFSALFKLKVFNLTLPFFLQMIFFTNALINVPKGQGQFDVIYFREKLKNQKHNHENLS